MQTARQLVAIALVCLAAACAAPPHHPFSFSAPPPTQARLYVYRDSGPIPFRDATIFVDGKQLSELGNHEYVSTVLAPGNHTITAKWGSDLRLGPVSAFVEAIPNEAMFIRLTVEVIGTTSAGIVLMPKLGTFLVPRPAPDAMTELTCCAVRPGAQ